MLQALLAFLYPAAVWETDLNSIALADERACFSRVVDALADTVIKSDLEGRPTARTVKIKGAIRVMARRIRDGDSAVADTYAKAGERLAEDASKALYVAGDAAARASATPRRPLRTRRASSPPTLLPQRFHLPTRPQLSSLVPEIHVKTGAGAAPFAKLTLQRPTTSTPTTSECARPRLYYSRSSPKRTPDCAFAAAEAQQVGRSMEIDEPKSPTSDAENAARGLRRPRHVRRSLPNAERLSKSSQPAAPSLSLKSAPHEPVYHTD